MTTSHGNVPAQGRLEERSAVEVLCGLAGGLASGKAEFTDGRKRWVFYLKDGQVEMTQSNLRSEQLKALKTSAPAADGRELLELQLTVRVIAATELSEGDWRFEPGVQPPKSRPADLLAACWQVIQRRYAMDRIETLLKPRMTGFPDLRRGGGLRLSQLPLDNALKDMLAQLDKQRSLSEVLDFAPVDAEEARRAVLFGMLTGIIDFGDSATDTAIRVIQGGSVTDDEQDLISEMVASALSSPPGEEIPRSSQPAPTAPPRPAAENPIDDIGAFIAQELGQPAPPPPPVASAPAQAPIDEDMARLQRELGRMNAAQNEFDVLGVVWDATEDTYRKAYFALARDFHPDRWHTKGDAHGELADQIFARVSGAWEHLGEPEARQAYIDRVIHGKKTEDELAMEKVQLIFAAETAYKEAIKLFRAGRFQPAHDLFVDCVEKVPEEKVYVAYLGYTTFRLNYEKDEGASEGGIEMIKAAIDQGTKLHEGWTLLGQAYRLRSQDDMARRCFVQALRINPSSPDAYREMKRMQAEKEREEKKGGLFGGLFSRKKK